MHEEKDNFYSLAEAGKYAKVGRQAIFVAIKKGQLKAEKRQIEKNGRMQMQWVVSRKDLDEYRAHKYSREKRIVQGKKLFDLDQDRWSVLHASKTLTAMLGRRYPPARLYYLLRIGLLRASKNGGAWVISKQELVDLYHTESGTNTRQMEMV